MKRRVTIGVAAVVCAAIVWRWLFPPFPDEQQVIALYIGHEQEFAQIAKLMDGECTGHLTPEVTAIAERIDPRMRVVCDYDRTLRFILGFRGLMAIGPEVIIGLTYIPGDPKRKGAIVPELKPHIREVGEVYLRQVNGRWYVFTQNTE